mgnify:FL=1
MSLNKNCPKHHEGAVIAQRFRLLKNPITTFSVTILIDLKFLKSSHFELSSPNSRGDNFPAPGTHRRHICPSLDLKSVH